MSPNRRASGFTLVELLMVVLIIGILATIALPRFLGQRTRSKNTAAQAAVRHALVAARSYYTQSGESYAGLGPSQLQRYESSLGSSEPADTVKPGDGAANPQSIWIGNGINGTNPDTVANGDSNGGTVVVLCSVSRGDTVYCVKDVAGVASYLRVQSSSTGVSTAAGGSFTANGWDSSAPSAAPVPSWASAMSSLSPVHWWRLNESAGSYADSGSGANASTYVGASVTRGAGSLLASDAGNLAATFAGNTLASRVGFGNVTLSSSYTISVAFRISDTTYTAGWRRLLSGSVGLTNKIDFGIARSSSTYPNALFVGHYGSTYFPLDSTTPLSPNTTYLAQVVYSDADDTIKIYLNGALDATLNSATQNLNTASFPVSIGQFNSGIQDTAFGGTIDEVAIWNSALSPANIASLWASWNA